MKHEIIESSHLSKRYQIFISSTYKDLIQEREELSKALSLHAYISEGMELFPATDQTQWDIITERIKFSDIYVIVVGARYGSIAENTEEYAASLVGANEKISYTHLEFRYAKSINIPIVALIKDIDYRDPELEIFIAEINKYVHFRTWKQPTDLVTKVLAGIHDTIHNRKAKKVMGWVKADAINEPLHFGNEKVYLKSKVHVAKFLSFSNKLTQAEPLYSKFVPRVEKTFPVWDEYITTTVYNLSHIVDHFEAYVRTDGDCVDFHCISPYLEELDPPDIGSRMRTTMLNPKIPIPSQVYVTQNTYLNGFQDGNMDIMVKTDKFTEQLKLLVDFTSLPNFKDLLKCVACEKYVFGKYTRNLWNDFKTLSEGKFYIEDSNLGAESVLRFLFAQRIFIFGYGSLINFDSAAKTLHRDLQPEDVKSVQLKGFSRVWNYKSTIHSEKMDSIINGVYLNLAKKPQGTTNGILFEVSFEEFDRLKQRERNYAVVDITKKINEQRPDHDKLPGSIITFVCFEKEYLAQQDEQCFVMQKYIDMVKGGCQVQGADFTKEYDAGTESIPYPILEGAYRFV